MQSVLYPSEPSHAQLTVVRYSAPLRDQWNAFVAGAKNGLFLFHRDYMDYHADRFADSSLMVYREGELAASFPANRSGDTVTSHAGLTFGGLVLDSAMTTPLLIRTFAAVLGFLKGDQVRRLIYKCIPHIYHLHPAEEDRYALFLAGGRLWRRDLTSTIDLCHRLPFQTRRSRGVRKAAREGVTVVEGPDFSRFWPVLEQNLRQAHGVAPVHSLAEIVSLHGKFPNNIRLFTGCRQGEVLAGVVVYENPTIAHAQYIASTPADREIGALDAVFDYLINDRYRAKRYFDFGVSTEEAGKTLNGGLVEQKEGFGARAVVHDFYELDVVDSHAALACWG